MKLYYFLTSLLNPLALGWMRLKTRFRPDNRVRVLLRDEAGRILLIRPVIGMRKWELPGGMPKENESFETAVARELTEETGLEVRSETLAFIMEYLRPYPMRIYEAQAKMVTVRKNMFEIRHAEWFSVADLPADTAQYVKYLVRKKVL